MIPIEVFMAGAAELSKAFGRATEAIICSSTAFKRLHKLVKVEVAQVRRQRQQFLHRRGGKMKRTIALLLVVSLLIGCAKSMTEGVKTYPPYGLFDPQNQSQKVCYGVSVGNVVWSIILIETIVVPVILVGWYLYEPVRMKRDANEKCGIDA